MKYSPTARLQNAQARYAAAQEQCPHWDYENGPECGFGCCHELDDAQRELRAARIAFRIAGGSVDRLTAIRRAEGYCE